MPRKKAKKKKPVRKRQVAVEVDDAFIRDLEKVTGITGTSNRLAIASAIRVYRKVLECDWRLVNDRTGAEVVIV